MHVGWQLWLLLHLTQPQYRNRCDTDDEGVDGYNNFSVSHMSFLVYGTGNLACIFGRDRVVSTSTCGDLPYTEVVPSSSSKSSSFLGLNSSY